MRLRLTALLLLSTITAAAQASGQKLLGDWREPGGSVIRVAPCGDALCLTLVAISKTAPSQVDHHNPDASLRTRPLCGVVIGRDFHAASADHAEDGTLYDPKTGKTYHGEMTASGDTLALHGYIGAKIFGRTENWTRTAATSSCAR